MSIKIPEISAHKLVDTPTCKTNQSECGNGQCLPTEYFCDGSLDCVDGSDEKGCDLEPFRVEKCNPKTCKLPDCFCSHDGTLIPGGLEPRDVPQMIIITFDDAVNYENYELYSEVLFDNFRNPNGCPVKATFFVSHQFNNYQQTQKLWNDGHEIGVHSVTYVVFELF